MALRLLLLFLISGSLNQLLPAYRAYGNSVFSLSASPVYEAFGPMAGLLTSGSENAGVNALALNDGRGRNFYLSQALWYANALNSTTGAFSFQLQDKRQVAVMLSRISLGNVADSRGALLDYGADGLPATFDEGEGNGRLDPGERLNYDNVTIHSLENYCVTVAFPFQFKSLQLGVSSRFMMQDLLAARGYGLAFDLYFQKKWKRLQGLFKISDLPSGVNWFDNGHFEMTVPAAEASFVLPITVAKLTLRPGLSGRFTPGIRYMDAVDLGSAGSLDLSGGLDLKIGQRFSLGGAWFQGTGVKLASTLELNGFTLEYAWRGNRDALGMSHVFALKFDLNELLSE